MTTKEITTEDIIRALASLPSDPMAKATILKLKAAEELAVKASKAVKRLGNGYEEYDLRMALEDYQKAGEVK